MIKNKQNYRILLFFVILTTLYESSLQETSEQIRERYDTLLKLTIKESDVKLLGIGYCMGKLIFFINRPYYYVDSNSQVGYDITNKKFQVLSLRTDSLKSYRHIPEIMEDVCNSQDPNACIINAGSYFSIHQIDNRCYAHLHRERSREAFSSFDIDKDLMKQTIRYGYHPFGIPLSDCGYETLPTKFLYYGPWAMRLSYCPMFAFRPEIEQCEELSIAMKHFAKFDYTAYMLDNTNMTKRLGSILVRLMNRQPYIFSACFTNRYILVKDDYSVVVKELNKQYMFSLFGFNYLMFENPGNETPTTSIGEMFNAFVEPPKDLEVSTPATKKQSAWIVTSYTDPPPNNTDSSFSGMPLKTQTILVTFFENEIMSPSPFGKSTLYILFGTVGVVILLCIIIAMLSSKKHRRHRKHKHIRTMNTIVLNIDKAQNKNKKDKKRSPDSFGQSKSMKDLRNSIMNLSSYSKNNNSMASSNAGSTGSSMASSAAMSNTSKASPGRQAISKPLSMAGSSVVSPPNPKYSKAYSKY